MSQQRTIDAEQSSNYWATADHDVVAAVEKIARDTGATVQAVINEVDRRGLGMEPSNKELGQAIQNFTTNNVTIDKSKTSIRGDSHFAPVLNILNNINAKLTLLLGLKDEDSLVGLAKIAFVVVCAAALVVFQLVPIQRVP